MGSYRRRVYIMRHAERVDFTFGNWLPSSFDADGNYIRTDLNMPVSVPPRRGGPKDFFKDCPLTNVGCYQATLTGEAFKEKGIKFKHVFCSPSYRCIQTCSNALKANGQEDLPIHIEPALFEWLRWYKEGMPVWLMKEDLRSLGYNISLGYKPVVPEDSLTNMEESITDYYIRSYFLINELINTYKDGNILLVGHAATLDTCTRQLLGHSPREEGQFMHIIYNTPYGSCLCVEEGEDYVWRLADPQIPSGSVRQSNNNAFKWTILT